MNLPDRNEKTPIHHAVSKGHTEAVKMLISQGFCEYNPLDREGKTPLDMADKIQKVEIIHLLLNEGAKYNKDTVFSDGFNPKEREMVLMTKTQEVKEVKAEQIPTVKAEMKKGELDDIILKALACQIMLTEQAIYKGESLVDGIDHHELSEHLWEETAFHAQLVTLRRQELKEYQEAYAFLSKKEEELKKIDINRIRELVAELDEFNKLKLSEIEFIEDSEIIKIEPSLIEDFKLSNKDFLMTDFYKTGFGSEKEDE